MARKLKPLALESARCNAGARASEAAWLSEAPHITDAGVQHIGEMMVKAKGLNDRWRLHMLAVRGRVDSLTAEQAAVVRTAESGERRANKAAPFCPALPTCTVLAASAASAAGV